MKKSINRWSFPEKMPLTECFQLAKNTGFDAVELVFNEHGEVSLDSKEKEITAIRSHARDAELSIASLATGLGWSYPLSSPDPKIASKAKKIVARMLEVASWLGTDAILVVPALVTGETSGSPAVTYEQAYLRSSAALKELLPVAAKFKVTMAVENVWNNFLLSPLETRDFVDHFNSPWLGFYFDVGNVIPFGFSEQWVQILGRRIRRIHLKDYNQVIRWPHLGLEKEYSYACLVGGFVNLGNGNVNYPAVMAALKAVNYKSYLTVEWGPVPGEDLKTFLKDLSHRVDKILLKAL